MSDADKLVGQTLAGKYLIKRVLGVGGMGAVYEGQHVEIGKRVAVKVISETSAAHSAEAEARFKREARAASAVESEHIVQVFDVGQDPNAGLYMVMEFLVGEDLATRLEREKRLDIGTALIIASQAARGLAKAHAAGVVHRDLKPANIFLISREDGSLLVKVLDFGISKLLQEETEVNQATTKGGSKLTRVGSVIGTPQYMSPEQAQGLPSVDHRTDVWSLGAVLYECLAGRSAYEEMPTYEQTIIKIVTTQPTPLSDSAPWVPQPVAAVVHRALTQAIDARMPDCGSFARGLVEAMPHMFPDASGQYGASRANLLQAPNSGYMGSNPAIVPEIVGTGTGRAVVSPSGSHLGAPPLSQREMMENTALAMSPGQYMASGPRTASVTTGSGVVVGPQRPGTGTGARVLDAQPSMADDPVDIPGVAHRKSTLMMVLTVFAVATLGGLAVGGVLVMKGRDTTASAAASQPQGLVVQAPIAAPAPAPTPAPVPVAAAALPIQPIAAAPTPTPAPAPASSAKKTPSKTKELASAPATSAAPKPAAPAKETAGGGAFGGVNISSEY